MSSVSAGLYDELVARITHYLSGGGLFNPEEAFHDRVRSLMIECREALRAAGKPTDPEALPEDGAEARLLASNELLRSCFQVAKRENETPETTNWPPLVRQLEAELAAQHEITNRLRAYAQRVRETERREPDAMTPEEEEMALRSGEKKPPCHRCKGKVEWYQPRHNIDDCVKSLAARVTPEGE